MYLLDLQKVVSFPHILPCYCMEKFGPGGLEVPKA